MQITGQTPIRRDPRYRFPVEKRARIEAGLTSGQPAYQEDQDARFFDDLEATVRDISLSGAALNSAASVSTGQYVELHIDGVPPIAGNVVRAYGGVVAIQFKKDEAARLRLEREVSRLNRVA